MKFWITVISLTLLSGCKTVEIASYAKMPGYQIVAVNVEQKKVFFFQRKFWKSKDDNLKPLSDQLDKMYRENGVVGKKATAEDVVKSVEEVEKK